MPGHTQSFLLLTWAPGSLPSGWKVTLYLMCWKQAPSSPLIWSCQELGALRLNGNGHGIALISEQHLIKADHDGIEAPSGKAGLTRACDIVSYPVT